MHTASSLQGAVKVLMSPPKKFVCLQHGRLVLLVAGQHQAL